MKILSSILEETLSGFSLYTVKFFFTNDSYFNLIEKLIECSYEYEGKLFIPIKKSINTRKC